MQYIASEPVQHHGSHHFHPLPLAFIHTNCHLFHALSVCLSVFLWTFGPRILLEPHPEAPLALKNRWTKNITHLHRHTKPTHDVIRQQSVWAPCVCRCLSLPPQTLRSKASQQRPQPERSTASLAARPHCAEETAPCNTNNPSATAALQHQLLILVPPCEVQHCNTHTALGNECHLPLGFNMPFQCDEIFKSIVSQECSTVAFVLNIAALICWVATVMVP